MRSKQTTTAIVKRAPRGARARAGAAIRADIATSKGARATVELRVLGEVDIGQKVMREFTSALTRGLLGGR